MAGILDFLTGAAEGYIGTIAERKKMEMERQNKLEQIYAEAKSKQLFPEPRMQAVMQSLGVLGEPAPITPQAPVMPRIAPSSRFVEKQMPYTTRPGPLRGIESIFRGIISPGLTQKAAIQQLGQLISETETASDLDHFLSNESVKRMLEDIGVTSKQVRQFVVEGKKFKPQQEEYRRGMARREQAKRTLDVLGYKTGLPMGLEDVLTGAGQVSSDEIVVADPEGNTYALPRSQRAAALAQGFSIMRE